MTMRKKWTMVTAALFVSVSLLTTGCNTRVMEHENQALKTELDTVKKQLDTTRQQVKTAEDAKAKLEKVAALTKSPDVDETTLPQLAYIQAEAVQTAFYGAYGTGMPQAASDVDSVRKLALKQYRNMLVPIAVDDFINSESKRLQSAWTSRTAAAPVQDRLKQVSLKEKRDKSAVVEAIVTRTPLSATPTPAPTGDVLLTITMEKTQYGWKLSSMQTGPVPPAQPAVTPADPTQNKNS